MSACAYAFLGGVDRTNDGGKIGFHQFYSADAIKSDMSAEKATKMRGKTEQDAQVISVSIISYLTEMGIDHELLANAVQKTSGEMYYPTEADLDSFNVLKTAGFSDWEVQPYNDSFRLTATSNEKDWINRVKKAVISCEKSKNTKSLILQLITVSDTEYYYGFQNPEKPAWFNLTTQNSDIKSYYLNKNEVEVRHDVNGKISIILNISQKHAKKIIDSDSFDLSISSFGANGHYGVENNWNKKEKDFFKILYNQCY